MMDDAYVLQLKIQQAHYLAQRIDPFWAEGDPHTPGHTPESVLDDLGAAMRHNDGDIVAATDDLARDWHIPTQDTAEQQRAIVARHIQTANVAHDLVSLLRDGAVDGAMTWQEVVALHGDDDAAAAAVRATAHSAAAIGLDAHAAVAQGIPAYAAFEAYPAEDMLAAIAHAVDHGADVAALAAAYGDAVDPIHLAAALRITPDDLLRSRAPGIDLA